MEELNLQTLIREYRQGGQGLDRIFERIATSVYRCPRHYGFDGEDDAAEALCHYRERVCGLAERYVDNGSSFEAYVTTSLRFLARTMRREQRKRREREMVCERSERFGLESRMEAASLPPIFDLVGSDEDCLAHPAREKPSVPELSAFKSRLVYLYLKCAWAADDEKTGRVAAAAGVPVDWLAAAAAQSLRSLEAERARFERLSLRRDRSWARMRLLEGRLRDEVEPAARKRIEDAIVRERLNWDRARQEIRAFKPVVPNSVVARILGIPKGTVDSGLYYLKKREGRRSGL